MAGVHAEPMRRLAGPPEVVPTPDAIVKALAHPLRRRVLRALHGAGEARSSRELGEELGIYLSNVSYHVKVLRKLNVLALTDTRPVRGSVEKFYASTVENNDLLRLLLDATQERDQAR